MSDLPKNSQIAYLCKLSYQFKSNIISILPNPDAFHSEVVFSSGSEWLDIYFTQNKIDYSEPSILDVNGIYFDKKLKLTFPNEAENNLSFFQSLENKELIIRMEYSNGNAKLFGNLDYPVQCLIHYTSAIDTAFELECFSKSPKRSVWLSKTTNA